MADLGTYVVLLLVLVLCDGSILVGKGLPHGAKALVGPYILQQLLAVQSSMQEFWVGGSQRLRSPLVKSQEGKVWRSMGSLLWEVWGPSTSTQYTKP